MEMSPLKPFPKALPFGTRCFADISVTTSKIVVFFYGILSSILAEPLIITSGLTI